MKKLLFIGVLLLLVGCTKPTFEEDPKLKESERIAVLEKVKTDTTTVIIQMDNKTYLLQNKKIISVTSNQSCDGFNTFVSGFLIGLLLTLIIVGIASIKE